MTVLREYLLLFTKLTLGLAAFWAVFIFIAGGMEGQSASEIFLGFLAVIALSASIFIGPTVCVIIDELRP